MTQRLINAMKKAQGHPLALDKATLCVTLDVIGRVGFAKDFGATSSFEAAIEGKLPAPPGAWPPHCMCRKLVTFYLRTPFLPRAG